MGADTAVVAPSLERGRCRDHAQMLLLAEKELRDPTGGLADEHDIEAALQDLVDAEIALSIGFDDSVTAENAHTGVAFGYHQLRLYELALPMYEAAYAIGSRDGRGSASRTMWQANIATMHLQWALELSRVGHTAEAQQHSQTAGEHAILAFEQACGPEAELWRQGALLLAGCAAATGPDPAEAAASIQLHADVLAKGGQRAEVAFCWPFLAIALRLSGQHDQALEAVESAVQDLPEDAGWLMTAAVHHTRAVLLADKGGPSAKGALAYGDSLAQALWRQRQRTLQMATMMKSYDRLRSEHARVALHAETDCLTDLANRRAFDRVVKSMELSDDDRRVAVLLVDVDAFKQINDTQGHAVGDSMLRIVSGVLAAEARDGDLVARLGGDEFVVLLPGAGAGAAYLVADRMAKVIEGLAHGTVTVSIGVASGAGSGVLSTLHAADTAMYVAKRAGGNQASLNEPV